MDFNDFLRNTKTAAEEEKGGVVVPKPAHAGHKRSAEGNGEASAFSSTDGTSTTTTFKKHRRSGTAEGLNLQAAQDALAQERGSSSAHAQQQRAQADFLSEQAAARMTHQVLEYVLQAELGGRHNAAKGGVAPFIPTAAQLAAEKAMWTPAAGYAMHHVVPAGSEASATSLEALVSVTEKERVPEGIRLLRSSLQMCDAERDLVGGVRSGMAPHLRAHVLEVLERGLRGEAWVRDDATVSATFAALGKPTTPEKGPSSVLLFRDSSADERGVAGKSSTSSSPVATVGGGAPHSGAESGGFSLSAFLNGGDDSSSSAASSDAEENE